MDDRNWEDPNLSENETNTSDAEPADQQSEYDFLMDEEPIVITDTEVPKPEEAKRETKKSAKIGTIIGVLFIVAALCIAGVIGIITLSRKGSMKEQEAGRAFALEQGTWTKFQVYCAMPYYLTMTHSVNFIPTAKEYYYLVFSEDFSSMALLRANKSWYDDNFTDWYSNDESGVTVEGYVRKTDHEVMREMNTQISKFQYDYGKSFHVNSELYVDVIAVRISIYEIIIMAIPLVCVILFFTVGRRFWNMRLDSKPAKYFLTGLLIGGLVYGGFVIHVLEFVL